MKIKTINGWRAVFAIIIVLFHVGVSGLEELTWAGVTFFLMASGFLLALKHPFNDLDAHSYGRFAWRHALKFYPLHWLVLVFMIIALAWAGKPLIQHPTLELNALLLQSWLLSHHIYFSYNQFAWFLSTLLFCYLCYPLLARWFKPLNLRIQLAIIIVLVIIDVIVLAGQDLLGQIALYVFPPVRLIDFIIGMTLACACQSMKNVKVLGKSENGTDLELISIALLSVTVMFIRAYPAFLPWSDAIIWWPAVAVLIMGCLLYNKREGFIGKFMASRPMQWLGDISFEMFMLQGFILFIYSGLISPVLGHFNIIEAANVVSNDLFGTNANLMAVFALPIDIFLAWIVNRLFTRPVSRLLNRHSS